MFFKLNFAFYTWTIFVLNCALDKVSANFWFWMDVEMTSNNNFVDSTNNPVHADLQNFILNSQTFKTNASTAHVAFEDSLGTFNAHPSLNGKASVLCEMISQPSCPCGPVVWVTVGGNCYSIQHIWDTVPWTNADCPFGGTVATNITTIVSYWQDIRDSQRFYCGTGCFGDGNFYYSYPTSTTYSWQTAEQFCINSSLHLVSFDKSSDYWNFMNIFQNKTALKSCLRDIWLGYNRYAFSAGGSIFSSVNYQHNPFVQSITDTDDCIYYKQSDLTYWHTSPCSSLKSFICKSDSSTSRCPAGWKYIPPYCYQFLPTQLDFPFAKISGCPAGTTIASFHTQDQWDDFLDWGTAFVNLNYFDDFYVGYEIIQPLTTWSYVDGTDATWANWIVPPSTPLGSDYCAVAKKVNNYKWSVENCNISRGILCQTTVPNSCVDKNYSDIDGQCYKYLNVTSNGVTSPNLTWDQAARECNLAGGTLPIFNNLTSSNPASQWKYFQRWRLGLSQNKDIIWIGLSQYVVPGKMQWMTTTYFDSAIDNSTWKSNPSTNPYIASLKSNSYLWTDEISTLTTNIICHMRLRGACPSFEFYPYRCTNGGNNICCYLPSSYTMNFATAESYCRTKDPSAHLLDFQSSLCWSQYQDLHSVFLAMQYSINDFWVGYSRGPHDIGGNWVANNFGKPDISNASSLWLPAQPDGLINDGISYCISGNFVNNGQWNDTSCINEFGFVCEIDIKNSYCPTDWGEYSGTNINTCYKSFPTSTNKSSALSNCVAEGGSLPSFHSPVEWLDFQRYRWALHNQNYTVDDVWLGLSDSAANSLRWQWSDQTNYNWANWIPNIQPVSTGSVNCIHSINNPPSDLDKMHWLTDNCTSIRHYICQKRQTALINPCPKDFAAVGSTTVLCVKPITDDLESYFQSAAFSSCLLKNFSLPTFPNQQSWTDFVSWFKNMNQAKQWSLPVQKTWPMTSFWIGLRQENGSYVWDDGSIFTYGNFPGPDPPSPQKCCYFADVSTANYSWIQADCSSTNTNKSTIICQSGAPQTGRCTNMYFAYQNNICYLTGTKTPVDFETARQTCTSLSNGYLPSFHTVGDWNDFLLYITVNGPLENIDLTQGVWIGLSDNVTDNQWEWDNDMNYNWANWLSGVEPLDDTSNHCVTAEQTASSHWVWRRRACNGSAVTICQTRQYQTDVCNPGWSDINQQGNCYKIIPDNYLTSVTFDQALIYCQSLGGTLPTFANNTEWAEFLLWKNNFASTMHLNTTDFWIGYYNKDQNFSSWTWTDNTLSGFTSWASSMPQKNDSRYCTASLQSALFNWTNYDCDKTKLTSVVCKYAQPSSVCQPGWLEISRTSSFCYKTVTPVYLIDKSTAADVCKNIGGFLPSFHSFQEYDEFNNVYKWYTEHFDGFDSSLGIWIGLNDTQMPFVWEWDDGTNFNWNWWQNGIEPSSNTSKQCAISIDDFNGYFVWKRQSCTFQAVFICQDRRNYPQSNCLPGWSDINGECFRLWPGIKNLNSNQIEKFCEINGGILPKFVSPTTWQQFLEWKINVGRGRNYASGSFWLGCCSNSNASNWYWNDNTEGTFINWTIVPSSSPSSQCSAAFSNQGYSWSMLSCTSRIIDSVICMQAVPYSHIMCPAPWISGLQNKCYLQIDSSQPNSFTQSSEICQSYDNRSTLPTFHTVIGWNEFNMFRWYFAAQENLNPIISSSVWIGLSDQRQENVYQNADGNFNWAFWNASVEPENNDSTDCVSSDSLNNGLGYWSAESCLSKKTAICQLRPIPDSDACGIPGWSSIGNRCYKIIPMSKSLDFYEANKTCNVLNATLPSFADVNQWQKFLDWRDNFGKTKGLATSDIWLAASYCNQTSEWLWTDKEVTNFTWTNWYSLSADENQCVSTSTQNFDSWLGRECIDNVPSLICQLIQYPVDCKMTDWVNGSCAQTCGNSTLISNRTIAQINLNNGTECSNDTLIIYDCLDQIPCPIDCQLTEWVQWHECDCEATDDGVRQRSRTVVVEPHYDGVACGQLSEQETCPDHTCWPMTSAERIAAAVLRTLGCVILLGFCAATIILCCIFRIFSAERFLHLGQEVAIILTHIFVLLFRQNVKNRLICTITAAVVQFGTLGTFTFILLEALQMYAYITNVTSSRSFMSAKFNLLIGIGIPILFTSLSASVFYQQLPAKYSCWLNIGHNMSSFTILPVCLCSLTTVVLLEAAAMGDFKRFPTVDKKKYILNKVNQRGLLFVLPLNAALWLTGVIATYYQKISLVTLEFTVIVAMAISIFVFHCLSHGMIYAFLKNYISKCFPCCFTKETETATSISQQKSQHGKTNKIAFVNVAKLEPTVTSGIPSVSIKPFSRPNENNTESKPNESKENRQNFDPFVNAEAFHRWVMDGRQDNMDKSEKLLFNK